MVVACWLGVPPARAVAQSVAEPGTADAAAAAPAQSPAVRPAPNVDLSDVVESPDEQSIPLPEGVPIPGEVGETTGTPAVDEGPSSGDPASETGGAPEAEAPATDDRQAPLVLLDAEVAPGTTTRLAWSPTVGFMGVSAPTPVLVVNGVKSGPTLCLTAAVHGDETNGIETVRRVLYSIDAQKMQGALIGVPIVNLESFRARSRYLPDRRDLNRFFPGNTTGSAASRIAHSFFTEVIVHCDQLIDLHTGSFGRTNLQQLRADLRVPGVRDLAEQMGRIVVVQSFGAMGTLRRAATDAGIPAVTLEAGGPNTLDREIVEESVASIENAMSGLGLLNRRKWLRRSDAPVFYRSRWIRASEGGFLISETRLGAEVESGALLGVVTNPITNQRSEIRSPFGGRVIGMALNQVMQPGYAAYHLGIDPEIADPVAGDDGDPFPDDAGHLEELDALEYSEEGFLDAGENIDDDPDTGR